MATHFDGVGDPLPARLHHQEMESARALDAVCRLANAVSADVLVYDRSDCTSRLVMANSGDRSDAPADVMLAAVRDRIPGVLHDPSPIWMPIRSPAGGVACLLKLSEQASGTFLIVLNFADDSALVRARVGKMAPDLAILIGFYVDGARRRLDLDDIGSAAMAAVDHGECGVIAIRSDRTIVFRNGAAATHLTSDMGLQVRRERITATDDRRFDAALQNFLDAADVQSGRRQAATVMLLKRKGGARPTVIVIAPVRPTSPHGPQAQGAAALVYIIDPAQGALRGLGALCQLHSLSGVESRLLMNLAHGLTLGDAAVEMRIKLETARSYLKQIFAKTGTHRQTDLLAMMTRYLRAFRGDFDFQPI